MHGRGPVRSNQGNIIIIHTTDKSFIYSNEVTIPGYDMSRIYKSTSKYGNNGDNKERCVILGEYIIETNSTVRETASRFGISKSTVHKDISERLEKINPSLAIEAKKVLEINKSERHIRGGMATKLKYQHEKSVSRN